MQAILDCAYESFSRYDENRDVWMTIRSHCKDLLGTEDYCRYYELCDRDVFKYKVKDNCLSEWKKFLDKFDPDYEDVGSSNYKGQAYLLDAIKKRRRSCARG